MILPLACKVCVGFGDAHVSRDGVVIWREAPDAEWDDIPHISYFERLAARDPDHDWRIVFHAPLSEAEYVRLGPCWWSLCRTGLGFA